jgi:hypothetical protein
VRVLPSILEYRRRFGKSPDRLMLSFAKLIEFYRTDMTNDSPSVCEAMRSVDVNEILRNKELWGEDISYLCDDLKRAMN